MHQDVDWANGMEGGSVHGPSGVRDYWTRQWQLIDPRVDPQRFEGDAAQVVVEVHQVVRDLQGKIKSDQMVRHLFLLRRDSSKSSRSCSSRPEHPASPEMPREQLLVRGFAEINWEAILDSLAGLSGLLGH